MNEQGTGIMNAMTETAKWIPIGELSRLTGISTHTLRIWEKRYGTPQAHRLPSGHRRYPRDEVPRLRAVAQALDSGFRAGRVVGASLEELQALLGVGPGKSSRGAPVAKGGSAKEATQAVMVENWIHAVHCYDEALLTQSLHEEWGRHGPLGFILDYASPFLKRLGQGWAMGELTVSQEHFASERLSDFLAGKWRTLNDRKEGPAVVLTTLPGETHRLGLLMCAVITSLTRFKVLYLGADTPLSDVLDAVRRSEARMVAVSVSSWMARGEVEAALMELRKGLAKDVELVAGGAGAPDGLPGIHCFSQFREYFDWLSAKPTAS